MIFAVVAMILDNVLNLKFSDLLPYGYIYAVYMLAVILPCLAVLVRRLHDIDKSGLWFFISFVPIIGGIWLLILVCKEGTSGPNRFGADPKQV